MLIKLQLHSHRLKINSKSGLKKLNKQKLIPRLLLLLLRPKLLLKKQSSLLKLKPIDKLWKKRWPQRKLPLKHKLQLKKHFSLQPSKLEKNLQSNKSLNMNLRCKRDNLNSKINSEMCGLQAQLESL